jgi:hypothetical protein
MSKYMECSLGEANSRVATQEISLHRWNPKVRYPVHKNLQLVSVLNQISSLHPATPVL